MITVFVRLSSSEYLCSFFVFVPGRQGLSCDLQPLILIIAMGQCYSNSTDKTFQQKHALAWSRPAAILLPPHLYGELAKTERGCELLRRHGDLKSLLFVARNTTASADDRKGALWAVVSARCRLAASWGAGGVMAERLMLLHDDIPLFYGCKPYTTTM